MSAYQKEIQTTTDTINQHIGKNPNENKFVEALRKNKCVKNESGEVVQVVPKTYHYNVEELLKIRLDMEIRVIAIDYEIKRRENEAGQIVLSYLASEFRERFIHHAHSTKLTVEASWDDYA